MEKPEYKWENLKVGMVIGERDVTVTPEWVAAHCAGCDSGRDWYSKDSPFGGPIAPPMIFINDLIQINDENFQRFGTIHAKLGFEFRRPVRVGETLHQKVTVKDLYVKREKGWVVSELVVTGEDGEVACVCRHSSCLSLTRKHEEPK